MVVRLLGIELGEKHEIYRDVAASATLRDGTYWLEILFSAGIATLGLILNSPAVIIGAMLISPLMGPILANGLALASGDLVLAFRALSSLLISALLAVGFATLLAVLLPFREMTAEIAARTQPNTLDLVIALFSGAVGSIAICKHVRGVATSIPGVAIAVALMPPLCVVGYGVGLILTLDRAQGKAVVRGGGLLFLTNLVAITLTAMLVFLLFHIGSAEVRERVRTMRGESAGELIDRIPLPKALARIGSLPGRLFLLALLVAVLVVPLTRSLDSLKREIVKRQFENRVQKRTTRLWQESFAQSETGNARSYIDTIAASEGGGRLNLHMRIFTSRPYSSEERADFVRRLALLLARTPESVDFSLVEIPTSRYEVATRAKSEEVEAPAPPAPPPPTAAVITDLRQRIQSAVETLRLPEPAIVDEASATVGQRATELEISYVSAREIDADGQALLIDRMHEILGDASIAVSLRRVPGTVRIDFTRKGNSLNASTLPALHSFADLGSRHPAWPIVVQAPPGDRNHGERLRTIRAYLTSNGIEDSRISVTDDRNADSYLVSLAAVAATQ